MSTSPERGVPPPLGDVSDDELGALVDDVLRSGKHSIVPAEASQARVDPSERLHARVIAEQLQHLASSLSGDVQSNSSERWFFEVKGRQLGPIALRDARALWEDGVLGPDSFCWTDGFSAWIPLSKVTELASVLAPRLPAAPPTALPTRAEEEGKDWTPLAPALADLASRPTEPHTALEPVSAQQSAGVYYILPPAPAAEPPPQERRAGWLPQSVITGVVAGAVMAILVLAGIGALSFFRPQPLVSVVAGPSTQPLTAAQAAPTAPGSSSLGSAAPAPGPASATGSVAATGDASAAVSASGTLLASGPLAADGARPKALDVPVAGTTRSLESSAPAQSTTVAATPKTPSRPVPVKLAAKTSVAPPAPVPKPQEDLEGDVIEGGVADRTPPPGEETFGDDEFDKTFGAPEKEAPAAAEPAAAKKPSVYIPPPPGSAPVLPATLGQGQVMEVVVAHKKAVQECVVKFKPADREGGKVVMRLNVSTAGTTTSVRAISPEDLTDSELAQCLGDEIATWTFPKHSEQMDPVEVPFVF